SAVDQGVVRHGPSLLREARSEGRPEPETARSARAAGDGRWPAAGRRGTGAGRTAAAGSGAMPVCWMLTPLPPLPVVRAVAVAAAVPPTLLYRFTVPYVRHTA